MGFLLGIKSKLNLRGVHPDLVKVISGAIIRCEIDFTVIEGVRTLKRQQELLAGGATTTLNSRHLTGHAVDLAAVIGGQIRWDWPLYHKIAQAMKNSALDYGVAIEWGGDWKKFPDGPHFQLAWKQYPIDGGKNAA